MLAAVSAAILIPLGVFGAPALARSASAASQYQYGGSSSQYQYKVALCHHTHSKKHPWHVITVSSSAVAAHMKHGDTPAPCPTAAPAQTKHASGQDDDQTMPLGCGQRLLDRRERRVIERRVAP